MTHRVSIKTSVSNQSERTRRRVKFNRKSREGEREERKGFHSVRFTASVYSKYALILLQFCFN